MTLLQRTDRPTLYYAEFSGHTWRIMSPAGECVDVARTAHVAAYEVDLLNGGRAHVDAHQCVGCRVVLDSTAVLG